MGFISQLRWWGLRLKILVWSFVPTALALVGVGLVSFFAFQSTTRTLLIERNRELIRVLATQLSTELENYPAVLSAVTDTPGFTAGGLEAKRQILNRAGSSLVVFDGGVVLTDEYGVIVATQPYDQSLIGQNWADRSYFRTILRAKTPAFSDRMVDAAGSEGGIIVAVPILGPQNRFEGMISGVFLLNSPNTSVFYANIVKLRIGQSEASHLQTYIVDGSGSVLYHTDNSQIGENYSGLTVVNHLLSNTFMDEFQYQAEDRGVFSGSAGVIRTADIDNRQVVAYYASIPGTPWGLVSESSWDGLLDYYRPYLLGQSFLFILGVLAPAFLVSYGIRRLTQPIYALRQAVEDVAAGNFGRQVSLSSGDELEELGAGFNHMSLQLAQSYAALQEREERLALVLKGSNDGIWDWNVQTNEIYFSPRWKSMLGYSDEELPNHLESWLTLIHPDDAALASQTLRSHFEHNSPSYQLEHRMLHKDGQYRWILARGILLRDEDGKPFRLVGSHTDITSRKQAEAALRTAYDTLEERVQERTRYLAALNNISALVNRSLDIHQTFQDALVKILEITSMQYGAAYRLEDRRVGVWLTPEETASLDAGNAYLNPLVLINLPSNSPAGWPRLPLRDSCIESFLTHPQPQVREIDPELDCSDLPLPFKEAQVEQLISIPLTVKSRLVGVIQIGSCQSRVFSSEEVDLLSAVGQQVGVSVENARLHDAVQASATLEERARLARELHDSVTQSLYSVTLLAEAAARLLASGDSETAAEHLHELREAAQESLREMRLLIYELRPLALEKNGLVESLRLRLEAVESRSGIKTELITAGEERLSYDRKAELFHIAQETLNNILKHAHATQVLVRLQFMESSFQMEIQDNGIGFDLETAAHSGGMGLESLVARAEKIGGQLQVNSVPGNGTLVCIEVPVSPQSKVS